MPFYGLSAIEHDATFLHLRDWNPVGIWYAGSFISTSFLPPAYIRVGLLKAKDREMQIFLVRRVLNKV